MIRMNYINDTYAFESDNIVRSYNKYLDSCLDDMEPVFSEYSLICDKIDLELMMMESTSEENMIVYEEAKKSFLQKVGEKILELRDKFIEFVDKMIDKIKTFTFNHSSNEQKLKKLLKEHPEFKNDTILAVREGTLNLTNIKSFKELNDDFDKIMEMARKGNIDPNSLKGKVDAAIEKHEKRLKKVAEVAGAASAIITAAALLATIGGKIAQHKKFTLEFKNAESKSVVAFYNQMIVHKEENKTPEQELSSKTIERSIYKRASDDDRKSDENKAATTVGPNGPNPKSRMYGRKTTMGEPTKIGTYKSGKYAVEPVRDKSGRIVHNSSDGTPQYQKVKIGTSITTTKTTASTHDVTYKYEIKEGKFKGQDPDKMYAQILLGAQRYREKGYAAAIMENFAIIRKFEDAMAKFYDDHIASEKMKKAFHDSMRAGNEEKHETIYTTTRTTTRNWTDDNGNVHNIHKPRVKQKVVQNKS